MTLTELRELLRNGESSTVEFKEDVVRPEDLAKEICALLNFEGGVVLLGVADSGDVVGTTRERLEEWAMSVCRDRLDPPVIPNFSWVRDVDPGRDVAVLAFAQGANKPYGRVHNARRTYYIRVGTTSQEASREELLRLFQASGQIRYGLRPAMGGRFEDLDLRRLTDYLTRVLGGTAPAEGDRLGWERLCSNLEFAIEVAGEITPTVDGILLFGRTPRKLLAQSGVRAIAYRGLEPEYSTEADETLAGPLVGLFNAAGELVEAGLVEQSISFIRHATGSMSEIREGVRFDKRDYPEDVVREIVVNALVHRDYSIAGTDIMINLFIDRLVVESPGRLPNTVSVAALLDGFRYARNQVLVNVMKDYRYAEFRGMGIRNRVLPGMLAFNGTYPELRETERSFSVTLLRETANSVEVAGLVAEDPD